MTQHIIPPQACYSLSQKFQNFALPVRDSTSETQESTRQSRFDPLKKPRPLLPVESSNTFPQANDILRLSNRPYTTSQSFTQAVKHAGFEQSKPMSQLHRQSMPLQLLTYTRRGRENVPQN